MIRKNKGIITVFITFVLVLVYIIDVCILNRIYTSYTVEGYSVGDSILINDIQYKVKQYMILSCDEFKKTSPSILVEDFCQAYIIVELSAENNTDNKLKISVDQFRLETTGWSSNISVKSFFYLNDEFDSYQYELEPNSDIVLSLPFAYYDNCEIQKSLDIINKSDISLNMYMEYPKKISVSLQ